MPRLSLAFVLAVLLIAPAAFAETIWERTKRGLRTEERLTREAVERVILGEGDDRDLMRVRVGIITLSRGEIEDPRTIVLLLRLRREMGLSSSALGSRLINKALSGKLSLTEQAWAHLEAAHLALSAGDLKVAELELERALHRSWRAPVRAETLVLRGFVALRADQLATALASFEEIEQLSASRRIDVQAQIGRALASALQGDGERMVYFARQAMLINATRASVSRRDPFWDVPLDADEHAVIDALLLWGEGDVQRNGDAERGKVARAQACDIVGNLVDRAQGTSGSWGARAAGALLSLWQETCDVSTPRTDEDNL